MSALTKESVTRRTCQTFGMLLDREGEFHPYAFCVWKKAGLDPWDQLRWTVEALGIDITRWPKRPPLVRSLR